METLTEDVCSRGQGHESIRWKPCHCQGLQGSQNTGYTFLLLSSFHGVNWLLKWQWLMVTIRRVREGGEKIWPFSHEGMLDLNKSFSTAKIAFIMFISFQKGWKLSLSRIRRSSSQNDGNRTCSAHHLVSKNLKIPMWQTQLMNGMISKRWM